MSHTIGVCASAQSLIQIHEGPQDQTLDVTEANFHHFNCECSNTSLIPFWSISGTVYDGVLSLPSGHRVAEGGLLIFLSEDLNGTSYQCLHVDRTTLEPVTSGTTVLRVLPSGKF